jgi:hypothetical protein
MRIPSASKFFQSILGPSLNQCLASGLCAFFGVWLTLDLEGHRRCGFKTAGPTAAGQARLLRMASCSNVLQELGPEGMDAAAKCTAEEIAELIIDAYDERGWR